MNYSASLALCKNMEPTNQKRLQPSISIPLANFVNFHVVSFLKLLGKGLKPGLIISFFFICTCLLFNARCILNQQGFALYRSPKIIHKLFYFTLNSPRCLRYACLFAEVHHSSSGARHYSPHEFPTTALKINSERTLWLR